MFLRFDDYLINMNEVMYFHEDRASGCVQIKLRTGETVNIWNRTLEHLMKLNVQDLLTEKEGSSWFMP